MDSWFAFSAPAAPIDPPTDAAEKDRIHSVAQDVARNDAVFLYALMEREAKNPQTTSRFLWPNSPSYPYFAFKVWSYRNPSECQKGMRLWSAPSQPFQTKQGDFAQMIGEYQKALAQKAKRQHTVASPAVDPFAPFHSLLVAVTRDCTKTNIQNAKTWVFRTCDTQELVNTLATLLATTLSNSQGFQERLHILYLINELLFNEIQKGGSIVNQAISAIITDLILSACQAPDIDATKKEKISKILSIWSAKNVFPPALIAIIAYRMMNPSGVVAPQVPTAPAIPDGPVPPPVKPKVAPQVPDLYQMPKKYFEAPAGMMVSLIPKGSKYYEPIPASLFNEPLDPSLFDSENLESVLNAFYTGLENQAKELQAINSNSNTAFEEATESENSSLFDTCGWEKGAIDALISERFQEKATDYNGRKQKDKSEYESGSDSSLSPSSGGEGRSRKRTTKRYRSSSRSRSGSSGGSSSRSSSRSSGRRRSRSPPSQTRRFNHESYSQFTQPGGMGMGMGMGGLGLGGNSEVMYDAFRASRSNNFSSNMAGRKQGQGGPGACFRCGRAGHIAKNCDDFK
ncbi:hypothetical protein BC830DRAFT_1226323 [Chytriomyces sp. MP71]|nr:hypothetical protein BC830DRAFT_1226323 [Chytriomyces sp. MP71]